MKNERGRVVVGVDGSAGSRAALLHALEDAARRGADVDVIAAFEHPEYWVPHNPAPSIPLEEVQEDVRRNTEAVVQEVNVELAGRLTEMPSVTVHAVPGGAARALMHAADGADLLVVGSRGRGGFGSLLLGSVSLSCALHATCPVTVVHAVRPKRVKESAVLYAAPAIS